MYNEDLIRQVGWERFDKNFNLKSESRHHDYQIGSRTTLCGVKIPRDSDYVRVGDFGQGGCRRCEQIATSQYIKSLK